MALFKKTSRAVVSSFFARNVPQMARSHLDVLADPALDSYYFVDNSIISSYHKREVPSLNRYVDHLSSKGPRFFVTRRIAREFTSCFSAPLPPIFHLYHDNDAVVRADFAYPEVLRAFGLDSNAGFEFKTDLHWLLESGFCLHACEEIPVDAILSCQVFALTLNGKLVHRFLNTTKKREMLERIIDLQGLEHLADIRLLDTDGSFQDVKAFS
eukprot:TRINITY_DN2471_c0_g1_i1.p1 TRINITY_DN2471_c0_g1~~TRINITY_DN2471_c0_g1_i1.p1  ORF type:complete len:212 (+),score=14.27 TRINITY_DN2471_c0_g1_i1:48-683(+)